MIRSLADRTFQLRCQDHPSVDGGEAPQPKPAPGGGWVLVFRQTIGDWTWDSWSKNAEDSTNDNYAILDKLEDFRGSDGKLKFKLAWPGLSEGPLIWKQTLNPTSKSSDHYVDGYEAIDVKCQRNNWGGLRREDSANARIDGAAGGRWWYAGRCILTLIYFDLEIWGESDVKIYD